MVEHVMVQKVLLLVAQLRQWYQKTLADAFTETITTSPLAAAHQLDAFVAMLILSILINYLERDVVTLLVLERAVQRVRMLTIHACVIRLLLASHLLWWSFIHCDCTL